LYGRSSRGIEETRPAAEVRKARGETRLTTDLIDLVLPGASKLVMTKEFAK
jgi:hypothetical protein